MNEEIMNLLTSENEDDVKLAVIMIQNKQVGLTKEMFVDLCFNTSAEKYYKNYHLWTRLFGLAEDENLSEKLREYVIKPTQL